MNTSNILWMAISAYAMISCRGTDSNENPESFMGPDELTDTERSQLLGVGNYEELPVLPWAEAAEFMLSVDQEGPIRVDLLSPDGRPAPNEVFDVHLWTREPMYGIVGSTPIHVSRHLGTFKSDNQAVLSIPRPTDIDATAQGVFAITALGGIDGDMNRSLTAFVRLNAKGPVDAELSTATRPKVLLSTTPLLASGIVVDPQGNGVGGVVVEEVVMENHLGAGTPVRGYYRTKSSADGRFELYGVATVRHIALSFYAPGTADPVLSNVELGSTSNRITIPPE